MDCKWIGAILIVASCSGCGFVVAAGKRREESLLVQLADILQFMEAELQYRLTPLPELCRMAAGEGKGILRVVFRNLYRELTWQKLPDAGSCMYAAIQRTGEIQHILSQGSFAASAVAHQAHVADGLGFIAHECFLSLCLYTLFLN